MIENPLSPTTCHCNHDRLHQLSENSVQATQALAVSLVEECTVPEVCDTAWKAAHQCCFQCAAAVGNALCSATRTSKCSVSTWLNVASAHVTQARKLVIRFMLQFYMMANSTFCVIALSMVAIAAVLEVLAPTEDVRHINMQP